VEDVFLGLQVALAENMPELLLFDEYFGQLETEKDAYPVTFPCTQLVCRRMANAVGRHPA